MLAERDAVVDEGRREAEQIVADAHREREKLISDTDVYRVAKREADQHRGRGPARRPTALRQETDDYVDAKLANFEITLERTTEAVKRGRRAARRPLGVRRADLATRSTRSSCPSTSRRLTVAARPGRPAFWPLGHPFGTLDDGSSRLVRAPRTVARPETVVCCAPVRK